MIDTNLELASLIAPLMKLLKAAKDEYKHAFFIGLEDYLLNRSEKYFLTNTFLHRGQKVKFMDIYYPLKIHVSGSKDSVLLDLDFLDNYKFITIIGTAGSGKSMIMKYLFLESIQNYLRIPIFIELRRFNYEKESFKKFIFNSILDANLEPSEKTLDRALKSGVYIFLFDGLDEVSLEKKEHFFHQLDSFIDSYSENKFVISSRPRAGAEQLPRFESFYVSDITQNEYSDFIKKVVYDTERQLNLFRILGDEENKQYLHYFSSPLLFSMFILTFESHPEIPRKKSAFYQNVFDTLYNKHDGITKNSFIRNRVSKLQKDEFIELLSYFSAITFARGEYYFSHDLLFNTLNEIKTHRGFENYNIEDIIQDLDLSISILVKDGLEYTFPHRSLQEYFTSLFIKNHIKSNDAKSKYISKLIYLSRYRSLDRHKQFWHLLYEVDKLSMIKHFLIPIFEEVYKIEQENGFQFTELFKSLDFGFYYLQSKKVSHELSNIVSKKTLKKIRKTIQRDRDEAIFGDSYLDIIDHESEKNYEIVERQLKIRHVDSIFWDAIEIRLLDYKNILFKSLNRSKNIEVFNERIANNFIEPIPDNYMISISTIMVNEPVEETLRQMGIDNLLIDFLDQIEEEIQIMKDELESECDELYYLFT